MTDVKHIRKLKNIIHEYDLEAPDNFFLCTDKELSAMYNGAGPDWLGEWGRERLTSRLDLFEAAFLVHDFEYACSDHTEEGFKEANKRMWQNMRKIIFGIYSWRKISDWDNIAYWLVKAFTASGPVPSSAGQHGWIKRRHLWKNHLKLSSECFHS